MRQAKDLIGMMECWNDGMETFGQITACGGEKAFPHQVKNKKVPGKENFKKILTVLRR
jgi:hypothetical protein